MHSIFAHWLWHGGGGFVARLYYIPGGMMASLHVATLYLEDLYQECQYLAPLSNPLLLPYHLTKSLLLDCLEATPSSTMTSGFIVY